MGRLLVIIRITYRRIDRLRVYKNPPSTTEGGSTRGTEGRARHTLGDPMCRRITYIVALNGLDVKVLIVKGPCRAGRLYSSVPSP